MSVIHMVKALEKVLRIEYSDHIVERATIHGDSRIPRLDEHTAGLLYRGADVKSDDVGARRHDLVHSRLCEVKDTLNHPSLYRLDDSLLLSRVYNRTDLVLRHLTNPGPP